MVFIIAEAGSNYRMGNRNQDLTMARALIEVAAESGADAVKFQVFRADKVYAAGAGPCDHLTQKGMSADISQIFKDLEMPYDFLPLLAGHCKKHGVELMASFFSKEDFEAVDPWVKRHKIASPELHHPRLLELAASSKKPTLLSTGISTEEEIDWAVGHFRQAGGGELTLLQCTVEYPAEPQALNLLTLPFLAKRFGVQVGLSDHSLHPLIAPVAAVALGAQVVEKHFTLHRRLVGPDHSWAITGEELKEMVKAIRLAQEMLGEPKKRIAVQEEPLRRFSRRGVQAIRSIKRGEQLREGENIDILRPGHQSLGMHPSLLPQIEGRKAKREIAKGEGIQEVDYE
jgi:N-acetylneuraminate synthase